MEEEPRIAAWNAKVDWPLTGLTLVFLAGYAWQVLDTSLAPPAREADTSLASSIPKAVTAVS